MQGCHPPRAKLSAFTVAAHHGQRLAQWLRNQTVDSHLGIKSCLSHCLAEPHGPQAELENVSNAQAQRMKLLILCLSEPFLKLGQGRVLSVSLLHPLGWPETTWWAEKNGGEGAGQGGIFQCSQRSRGWEACHGGRRCVENAYLAVVGAHGACISSCP